MVISQHQADFVVLNEYVEGPDHNSFLHALIGFGFPHHLISKAVKGQNQLLVVSRSEIVLGHLIALDFHPAVRPNILHAMLPQFGIHHLGQILVRPAGAGGTSSTVWALDASITMTPKIDLVGDLYGDSTTPDTGWQVGVRLRAMEGLTLGLAAGRQGSDATRRLVASWEF